MVLQDQTEIKMSTNRGIFESFPNQPSAGQNSPFAVVHEPVASPFTAAARQDSPFTLVDESSDLRPAESAQPVRLPERRRTETPFQVAEPTEGFGFEAPARAFAASPFEIAAPAPVPFSLPPQPAASPFSAEPQRGPSPSTQAAIAAFSNWQESQATPTPAAAFEPPAPTAFAPAAHVPSAFSVAHQAAVQAPADSSQSDSFSIRQLELRAIFGVDREMNPDEIMQRSRALPGMRNIARVAAQDMATIESLKSLLPNLGFGTGGLKLYAGAVPLEFIREGPVLLAVQTDGGFAPGVRETLMIVARELARLG